MMEKKREWKEKKRRRGNEGRDKNCYLLFF
jgi:hypothetical protein